MGNHHSRRSSSSLESTYGVSSRSSSLGHSHGVHTKVVKFQREIDYPGKQPILNQKSVIQKQISVNHEPEIVRLQCQYCSKKVVDAQLPAHLNSCPSNPDNIKIECENCQKAFNLTSYQRHLATCEESLREITLTCEMCYKGIVVGEYLDHVEKCQQNPQNHVSPCSFCGKLYTKEAYQSHAGRCKSNPDNVKINCKFCQKTLKKKAYDEHIKECEEAYNRKMEENECSICLLEIKKTDKTTFLACFHKFHSECIKDWSKKQKICPICRTDFPR